MKNKLLHLTILMIILSSAIFFIWAYKNVKQPPIKDNKNQVIETPVPSTIPWTASDDQLSNQEEQITAQLLALPGILSLQHICTQKELDEYVWTWKIVYQSDEFEVAGFISVPVDYAKETTGKYPCIILNRGGYGKHAKLSGQHPAYFAYQFHSIVFASQYRGVDGGTGKDEIGGDDVQDVFKLTDIACSSSLVDPDRLFMIGFSRGGMMTYRALCEDNRIQKAIVISGVSNLFMSYEERPDWKNAFNKRIGGSPSEFPEKYIERSAVLWAERIHTPIMLIHGKKDRHVSFAQSLEMYHALKNAGVPCKFRKRKDGVHGIIKTDLNAARNWLGVDGMTGLSESSIDLKL